MPQRVIWRLTDGRRGHDNQSLGLAHALQSQCDTVRHDIPVPPRAAALADLLCGRCRFGGALADPDLILGAGHATHLPMLAARRARGGRAVVIMNPSLPRAWFDVCLIPRHDGVREGNKVILTDGPINAITPGGAHDPACGLMLIGGLSAHYRWETALLAAQMQTLVSECPARVWQVSDSRRTPAATSATLRALATSAGNVHFTPHTDTPAGWVPAQLAQAGEVWITPDSTSMVYEALTSGARIGTFDLPVLRHTRVTRALDQLLERGEVGRFADRGRHVAGRSMLNEAARSAALLLARFDVR